MEPTLIKFEILDQPELLVVGKLLRVGANDVAAGKNTIPVLWEQCCKDGTFAALEALVDHLYDPAVRVGLCIDDMYAPASGDFGYICGMMMKPGTPVPEGFASRPLASAKVAAAWVKGRQEHAPELCTAAHGLATKAIEERGMKPLGNWCMEVYNYPRWVEPDAEGNAILDYYLPCK